MGSDMSGAIEAEQKKCEAIIAKAIDDFHETTGAFVVVVKILIHSGPPSRTIDRTAFLGIEIALPTQSLKFLNF